MKKSLDEEGRAGGGEEDEDEAVFTRESITKEDLLNAHQEHQQEEQEQQGGAGGTGDCLYLSINHRGGSAQRASGATPTQNTVG